LELTSAPAQEIGTYANSTEPFHGCCPIFLPGNPALHVSAEELTRAEGAMDVEALVRQGIETIATERYRYTAGRVEKVESFKSATA
jgi:thiamine biosynthesis protein ThiI